MADPECVNKTTVPAPRISVEGGSLTEDDFTYTEQLYIGGIVDQRTSPENRIAFVEGLIRLSEANPGALQKCLARQATAFVEGQTGRRSA